ncbi:MAG: hypothetical protein ACFE9T_04670, partial [Promethearchaeota archaeon]
NYAINNNFRNNDSFEVLFNTCFRLSCLEKGFIKIFFKFLNFSELEDYKEDKHLIKSLTLIYNSVRKRFQILAQYRPPLMMISLISYFFFIWIKF